MVWTSRTGSGRVEVEPHRERQPLAGLVPVYAFDLHDRAHGSRLLHRDIPYAAGELGEAQDAGCRAVFQRAGQATVARYDTAVDGHTLDECGSLFRDAALQFPVSMSMACGLSVSLTAGLGAGVAGARRKGPGAGRDRGESRELDRPIRPIGEGPRLQGQRLAVARRERESLRAAHRSARPGHAPTHAGLDSGCGAAQPADRHRGVALCRLGLERRCRGASRQKSDSAPTRDGKPGETGDRRNVFQFSLSSLVRTGKRSVCPRFSLLRSQFFQWLGSHILHTFETGKRSVCPWVSCPWVSHASRQRRVDSALQSMCGSNDIGPSYPIACNARK